LTSHLLNEYDDDDDVLVKLYSVHCTINGET